MWGETGGSETPASRTFYSRFPPLSVGIPDSLFYVNCKMLRNIAKFFSFSPGSRHFRNPASRPFSSRLPYPSRPLFSRAPAPPVPLHMNMIARLCYNSFSPNVSVNNQEKALDPCANNPCQYEGTCHGIGDL